MDIVSQIAIPILGLPAIFMVAKKKRWGFVVGLSQQPFWFFTTIYNHQWGITLLSVGYTISWIMGIYEWFWKEPYVDPDLVADAELMMRSYER